MADEPRTIRKNVSFSPSEWRRVDDWMFGQRIKNDSEAIRRLIQLGLAAAGRPCDVKGEE